MAFGMENDGLHSGGIGMGIDGFDVFPEGDMQ
jgi:hypothetical protein